MDFQEKFEELIESYNAGSRNIEDLFNDLVALSRNLSEEQQRHVRENMTEEELVIFDIPTRPAPELSAEERAEVRRCQRLFPCNFRRSAQKAPSTFVCKGQPRVSLRQSRFEHVFDGQFKLGAGGGFLPPIDNEQLHEFDEEFTRNLLQIVSERNPSVAFIQRVLSMPPPGGRVAGFMGWKLHWLSSLVALIGPAMNETPEIQRLTRAIANLATVLIESTAAAVRAQLPPKQPPSSAAPVPA